MMLGIPLRDAATALAATRRLLQAGYLVLTGGRDGNVITLSPSFVLDDAAIVAFAQVFATLVPPEAR
jgi:4-aminobutyrate aminotransferase-like enzyme